MEQNMKCGMVLAWFAVKGNQRTKIDENYVWFPVAHENSSLLKFEMPATQLFLVWLLSSDCGVSF